MKSCGVYMYVWYRIRNKYHLGSYELQRLTAGRGRGQGSGWYRITGMHRSLTFDACLAQEHKQGMMEKKKERKRREAEVI